MKERPSDPKGPNPWAAEVPGPGPEPEPDSESESETETGAESGDEGTGTAARAAGGTGAGPDQGEPLDNSGLLTALRQLEKRRSRHRDLVVGGACGMLGLLLGIVVGTVNTTGPGSAHASGQPSAGAGTGTAAPGDRGVPAGAATQTPDSSNTGGTLAASGPVDSGVVTMTVTGTAPDGIQIRYGTDKSSLENTNLPFTATLLLDSSGAVSDYALAAQLQGSGNISCSIEVNGTVLKTGTASGGDETCSAEIDQNPQTQKWQGK